MENIELVIKIDKDIAQGIINGENDASRNVVRAFQATIAEAIKNAEEVKTIKLEIVNQAKKEMQKLRGCSCNCSDGIIDDVEEILDKLIESGGK